MKRNYGRTVEEDLRSLGISPDRVTIAGRPGKPKVMDFTPVAEKPKPKATRTTLIKIPFPPRELHPNGRSHWSKVATAKKQQRSFTSSLSSHSHFVYDRPEISVTVYHATAHARDRDGVISSIKAAIDGLQDSGLIVNDSAVTWGSVNFVKVQKPVECLVLAISNRKGKNNDAKMSCLP